MLAAWVYDWTFVHYIVLFHHGREYGIKKARLGRVVLMNGLPCLCLQDTGARSPISCSPFPTGTPRIQAFGIRYSIVKTPNVHFKCRPTSLITNCPPHGRDFIVMKLEVLLLLRNTLISRLSSEKSAFVLVQGGNILDTVIIAKILN